MATSTVASGTQTAVIDTEHTLNASASSGTTRVCKIDLSNMVNGDAVTLRAYDKLDGTNYRRELIEYAANVQASEIPALIITSDQDIKFTLEQTEGTARNFFWRVLDL